MVYVVSATRPDKYATVASAAAVADTVAWIPAESVACTIYDVSPNTSPNVAVIVDADVATAVASVVAAGTVSTDCAVVGAESPPEFVATIDTEYVVPELSPDTVAELVYTTTVFVVEGDTGVVVAVTVYDVAPGTAVNDTPNEDAVMAEIVSAPVFNATVVILSAVDAADVVAVPPEPVDIIVILYAIPDSRFERATGLCVIPVIGSGAVPLAGDKYIV
jgi:hypothetical protein